MRVSTNISTIESGSLEEETGTPAKPDDDLPFACFICRGPFKSPVMTK